MPAAITPAQIYKNSLDLELPESIAQILALRGYSGQPAINDFLNPSLHHLPRPHLMKGMTEAVTILQEALQLKTPVTVYGDFDADGVTSTAILSLFLTELDLPFGAYIPDRLSEGYGLNSEALGKIHANNMQHWGEAGILLTADCGISDAEVVNEAKELGFSVIVTDHHTPPEKLPRADAILNPLQPGCQFPCKNLAGVGVAFYLILGMRTELMKNHHWPMEKIPNLKSYLDLVAIGTVADQVPLIDCNRIIVKAGLEVLNQANRIGLQTLLNNAKSSDTAVGTEDIIFRLAPRINAAGRIGSALKALKLLTSTIPDKAQQYANDLEEANNSRKVIEANIFSEAFQMASSKKFANGASLVLYKNDWHQGVLGIVASRLCDRFNRPVILLTDCPHPSDQDRLKLVKGSGRSIDGVNIHQAVSSCRKLLSRFGGHAGAVGLTLPAAGIESFRQQFEGLIKAQSEKPTSAANLVIDLQISLKDLADPEFLAAYPLLAPFGSGNPEPLFCIKSQKLSDPRQVGANHLKFTLSEHGTSINGIGFGFGDMLNKSKNSLMDLVFTLRLNSYMGQEKWEINLVDLLPAAP